MPYCRMLLLADFSRVYPRSGGPTWLPGAGAGTSPNNSAGAGSRSMKTNVPSMHIGSLTNRQPTVASHERMPAVLQGEKRLVAIVL